jgi:hypothetical protein
MLVADEAAGNAWRALTEEDLDALLDDALDPGWAGLARRPLPAVLDTDFIRTGLHYQLRHGHPPKSVTTARRGLLRLFMEYETLAETGDRLPRFAAQFGVPVADLRRMLNEDWLPHVDVVRLPAALRQADPRAAEVRDRDAADFPAAALAALLSPCLMLTCNYKHFGALGVRTRSQAVDGVMAVAAINVGESRVQALVMVPAAPALAAGGALRWASARFGPAAWVGAGLLAAGGIYWYRKQPPGRRGQLRQSAAAIGGRLLEEFCVAAGGAGQARLALRATVVPAPGQRTPAAAILRELATSAESLSAQQLAGLLDPSMRPAAASIRAFLRAHEATVFDQVRRGGFVLGSRYELPDGEAGSDPAGEP